MFKDVVGVVATKSDLLLMKRISILLPMKYATHPWGHQASIVLLINRGLRFSSFP